MYGQPPPALESAPPAMGPVPGDARPMSIRDHLMAAAQILLADPHDPEALQAVGEFMHVLQQVQRSIIASQPQMSPAGSARARAQGNVQSSGGYSPPSPGPTVPYGQSGVPKYGA